MILCVEHQFKDMKRDMQLKYNDTELLPKKDLKRPKAG